MSAGQSAILFEVRSLVAAANIKYGRQNYWKVVLESKHTLVAAVLLNIQPYYVLHFLQEFYKIIAV